MSISLVTPQAPVGSGFDLPEATVALACSQPGISLTVQAKCEIGKLWEDITKAPYKTLFNSSVSGTRVWQLVQILRFVEDTLQQEQRKREGRDRLFAVHGNRFVAWQVFQKYSYSTPLDPDSVKEYTVTAEVT